MIAFYTQLIKMLTELIDSSIAEFMKFYVNSINVTVAVREVHHQNSQPEIADSLHEIVKIFYKLVNITKITTPGVITHPVSFLCLLFLMHCLYRIVY